MFPALFFIYWNIIFYFVWNRSFVVIYCIIYCMKASVYASNILMAVQREQSTIPVYRTRFQRIFLDIIIIFALFFLFYVHILFIKYTFVLNYVILHNRFRDYYSYFLFYQRISNESRFLLCLLFIFLLLLCIHLNKNKSRWSTNSL